MRDEQFKGFAKMFLPILKLEAAKIDKDFAYTNCLAYASFPPNDSPEHGFFSMFIDVGLTSAGYDKTDSISLGIHVYDHTPKLTMNADVSWGYPSGKVAKQTFEKFVEVTDENLNILRDDLPVLIDKLRNAIESNPTGI